MLGLLAAGCAAGPDSSTGDGTDNLTGDSANHCDHCPPPPPPPPPAGCKYVGNSRVVDVHLLAGLRIPLLDVGKFLEPNGIHVPFSDASIGPSGGHAKADLLDLQIPNLLRARVLEATADGADCKAAAVAEVANVEVGLSKLKLLNGTSLEIVNQLLADLGVQADIQADVLKASASASCKDGKPVLSGDTIVAKLRIGNNNILNIVPGKANQKIELLGEGLGHGIYIAINEQIVESKGNSGKIQVNALHVNVLDLADVVVSAAEAGITCQ
ncbi:choice-of-anchor P family protein [Pendulispora albinea]|uniref:Uncharacterized protein n=1 Tax=Pendulispora albinea TaxID=2741071 RepID=A0ABZ2LWM1_9BACT